MLDIRNVKSVKEIPVLVLRLFSLMLVTAVCALFQSNRALFSGQRRKVSKVLGLKGTPYGSCAKRLDSRYAAVFKHVW